MEAAIFAHGIAQKMKESQPYNIHGWFLPIRFIALAACLLIPNLNIYTIFTGIAFCAVFPFFHDGMYYVTRNKLDGVNYNWFSESETTTARFSFDGLTRILLFGVGSFALIIITYLS